MFKFKMLIINLVGISLSLFTNKELLYSYIIKHVTHKVLHKAAIFITLQITQRSTCTICVDCCKMQERLNTLEARVPIINLTQMQTWAYPIEGKYLSNQRMSLYHKE